VGHNVAAVSLRWKLPHAPPHPAREVSTCRTGGDRPAQDAKQEEKQIPQAPN